ncbi:fimbrial protein [Acinetobacter guillouiae]|uniref:fimbrial protein n=1 Tax=Acinetobacter guillouiae TaxID=106649 RepID=UPI003342DF31
MKKLSLVTLSTLVFTLACTNVFAVDGTITVNGVITDGTCTLKGDGNRSSGTKDITVNLPSVPKSLFKFEPGFPNSMQVIFSMQLTNATGTGPCDAATSKAFKGIHLSPISPTDLDDLDKSLLVNRATGAGGASSTNPVFIRFYTYETNSIVDLNAPWGSQAGSELYSVGNEVSIRYVATVISNTGVVDAQNVQAKINYTMHYN